jgi:hypothetical protein
VVVLVEGRSDVTALNVLLRRAGVTGIDEVRLVDMGGATNIRRQMELFTTGGRARRILGLCDAHEEPVFARVLADTGVPLESAATGVDRSASPGRRPIPPIRAGMARYGFQVCDTDLEDELIRALGTARVLEILADLGLARGFERFGEQLAWRNATVHARLHRFAGVASGHKERVAGALAAAVPWPALGPPLGDLVGQIAAALAGPTGPPLQPFPDRDGSA